jgi:hypothetical protein
MELTHINQIDFRELRLEKMDCIVATIGSQPRCYHLAEIIQTEVAGKILLVKGDEAQKPNYKRHLPVFENLGFSQLTMTPDEAGVIDAMLKQQCNKRVHHINILIDYSCMPKKWYAYIIDTVTRNEYLSERINLYFSYTPKVFEKNPAKHAIEYMGPIVIKRDNLKEKKPVSLIASLDNHHNSIQEVIGKIKPQKILAFVPNCQHDPEYTQHVLDKNKKLLERLDPNSIIPYNADAPEELNTLLTSYCLDERISSEVLIVPQGPKTFSMMSMLLSVRYPDVKLWEVILRDQHANPEHGKPVSDPVIVKVSFMDDEPD